MNLKSCLVRDYMAGSIVSFKPETDVLDAIHELVRHRIAGAPVVNDQGELVGMLSELDCLKVSLNAGYYGDWGGPVADYMTPDVETVDADMNIVDLAQKFVDCGFRRFPVLRNNRLVGQISRRDVLRALTTLAISA
ncbi:MAG: CBS domain-containing protein [Woeseiaceae bacterium]|jgi:CBS domain-containing protein|nr:CBS domain-containing protein [Woeseiaceae bacterium]MDX2608383.1 CBS domain-containing protein [Woeseiaceae bacterium]